MDVLRRSFEAAQSVPLHYLVPALVFAGLFWLLYQLFLWPRFLSPLRHLPGPGYGHPIWGVFPEILKSEAGILQREWVKEYGGEKGIVRAVGPFGIERIILTSRTALKKILVDDAYDYPRPDFLRNTLGQITGYGLLTVEGNDHQQMRRAMNPAFSIPNLAAQTEMYYATLYGLVEIWENKINSLPDPSKGAVLVVYEWMGRATLDIICETAFGYKSDSVHNPDNELADAYERLIGLQSGINISLLVMLMTFPGVPRLLRSTGAYSARQALLKHPLWNPVGVFVDSMHRIKKVSQQILDDKMREALALSDPTDPSVGKKDVMSILVRSRLAEKGEGYRMTDEMMMNQVLTFLAAGHETTASGLSWTFWLLANHPDAQAKLRAEVQMLMSTVERPDYRQLKELDYLNCVVMESLRVMPPVPMTFRKAGKSDYIDGVWVPKDTIIYIANRVVNTDRRTWGPDAEEFRPERWMNLPETYNGQFSFQSFLAGAHHCIGRAMSIIEMKATLAVLVSRFSFEKVDKDQKPAPTAAITMKPGDGMPLRIKRVV